MKELTGGLKEVNGFLFSAIECAIKYNQRLDFALIFSKKPCNASGLFTTNSITAAPVVLCKDRINNPVHGILINATNANACTGEEGYKNAMRLTTEVANLMDVDPSSILMASTGVIGVQLPFEKMKKSIPFLIDRLSKENSRLVPEAIMTTDTFPKELAVSFQSSKGEYTIAGTAKGSGMIAPNMATLLAFILTDFPIDKKDLNQIFAKSINETMNSITIDGDTSTNDTTIILSPITEEYLTDKNDLLKFEEALIHLLKKLSKMLVMDGEGATKAVQIKVEGAKDKKDAQMAAKAISESLLVKTAIFGRDPNWGRIACAAGYSGAYIEESNLSIIFDDIIMLLKGKPIIYDKKKIDEVMSKREYSITVDLGVGNASASYLTTDISYDYVKINAEYTT